MADGPRRADGEDAREDARERLQVSCRRTARTSESHRRQARQGRVADRAGRHRGEGGKGGCDDEGPRRKGEGRSRRHVRSDAQHGTFAQGDGDARKEAAHCDEDAERDRRAYRTVQVEEGGALEERALTRRARRSARGRGKRRGARLEADLRHDPEGGREGDGGDLSVESGLGADP